MTSLLPRIRSLLRNRGHLSVRELAFELDAEDDQVEQALVGRGGHTPRGLCHCGPPSNRLWWLDEPDEAVDPNERTLVERAEAAALRVLDGALAPMTPLEVGEAAAMDRVLMARALRRLYDEHLVVVEGPRAQPRYSLPVTERPLPLLDTSAILTTIPSVLEPGSPYLLSRIGELVRGQHRGHRVPHEHLVEAMTRLEQANKATHDGPIWELVEQPRITKKETAMAKAKKRTTKRTISEEQQLLDAINAEPGQPLAHYRRQLGWNEAIMRRAQSALGDAIVKTGSTVASRWWPAGHPEAIETPPRSKPARKARKPARKPKPAPPTAHPPTETATCVEDCGPVPVPPLRGQVPSYPCYSVPEADELPTPPGTVLVTKAELERLQEAAEALAQVEEQAALLRTEAHAWGRLLARLDVHTEEQVIAFVERVRTWARQWREVTDRFELHPDDFAGVKTQVETLEAHSRRWQEVAEHCDLPEDDAVIGYIVGLEAMAREAGKWREWAVRVTKDHGCDDWSDESLRITIAQLLDEAKQPHLTQPEELTEHRIALARVEGWRQGVRELLDHVGRSA